MSCKYKLVKIESLVFKVEKTGFTCFPCEVLVLGKGDV